MKIFFAVVIMLSALPLYAQNQSPLKGKWQTGQGNTIVEIFEMEGQWKGKFTSSDNNKVEIGLIMLKDLRKTEGLWVGKIYSMRRKSWFNVEIRPNGNQLELKVFAGRRSRSIQWDKY